MLTPRILFSAAGTPSAGSTPLPEGGVRTPPPPPSPPKTPPSGETPDDASFIRIPRSEYDTLKVSSAKAAEMAAEKAALEANWNHAQRLLKRDSGSQEDLIISTRHVLKSAGFSDSEIESAISQQFPSDDDPPSDRRGSQPKRPPSRGQEGEEPSSEDQMAQRLESLQRAQDAERLVRLTREVRDTVRTQVDTHPKLSTLMGALVKINTNPEGNPEDVTRYQEDLKAYFQAEVERELKDRLRVRRAQARGAWEDQWIAEEGVKAAAAVHEKAQRLIPDPSRLGRVDQMGAGEEHIISNRKPVAAPTHRKGMTYAQAQSQVREWAADQLLRASHETSTADNRA